jgi:hypothetical protein
MNSKQSYFGRVQQRGNSSPIEGQQLAAGVNSSPIEGQQLAERGAAVCQERSSSSPREEQQLAE